MKVLRIALVVIYVGFGVANSQRVNVVNFGAKGDGQTDDSKAFLKAWEVACGAGGGHQTVEIPSGKTFLLQPLVFQGPCKSPAMHVQLDGDIVAPSSKEAWSDRSSDKWIGFSDVYGLSIVGSGKIDGRGLSFWKDVTDGLKQRITTPNQENSGKCDWPTTMHFNKCNNLKIDGITSINSPRNHISINKCSGVSISSIRLIAPDDSPNTDGINLSESTQVNILKSFIGTGDDCIAINTGCVDINIMEVTCSPGHGISVGSLGANGSKGTVENVRVKDCIFNRTMNGARIKTWPGGSGYVRNITFEKITLVEAGNPIIIDQHYANGKYDRSEGESAVAVSDVRFIDFHGTTSDEEAVKFDCSRITVCKNVVLDKVNITSSEGKQPGVFCRNVRGLCRSTIPEVPCLSK